VVPRFLVTRATGPAWDLAKPTREQAGWEPHAAFMEALADERFVAFGGPAGDEDKVVLVVDAPDEATVRARLELDSWADAGLLVTVSVEPWTIWLGGDERLGTTPPVPLYLVAQAPGPDWERGRSRRDQAGWAAHGAYMDALVDEGVVILGGPLDGERAVVVAHQQDETSLRARLAEDPWHDGILRIEQIAKWSLWLPPRPRPGASHLT
jgi:uncharacterized protein YciI